MALEPQGAALMVPSELLVLTDCMGTTGWLGRKGERWAFLLKSRWLSQEQNVMLIDCVHQLYRVIVHLATEHKVSIYIVTYTPIGPMPGPPPP